MHNIYLIYVYYVIALVSFSSIALIIVEAAAYRSLRIKSLVAMMISNVLGLVLAGLLVVRLHEPRGAYGNMTLLMLDAVVCTAQSVMGVWSVVAFFGTIRRRLASSQVD